MTAVADCALDMRGISKTFPGVKALSNVNFAVKFGTVHAVVGENGAGKSTLMKVLNGSYAPTSGTIRVGGAEVRMRRRLASAWCIRRSILSPT
nr:ATP-binding cassette domain-containing protein [Mesorhizobium sp. SARCC-RB16n]